MSPDTAPRPAGPCQAQRQAHDIGSAQLAKRVRFGAIEADCSDGPMLSHQSDLLKPAQVAVQVLRRYSPRGDPNGRRSLGIAVVRLRSLTAHARKQESCTALIPEPGGES